MHALLRKEGRKEPRRGHIMRERKLILGWDGCVHANSAVAVASVQGLPSFISFQRN